MASMIESIPRTTKKKLKKNESCVSLALVHRARQTNHIYIYRNILDRNGELLWRINAEKKVHAIYKQTYLHADLNEQKASK